MKDGVVCETYMVLCTTRDGKDGPRAVFVSDGRSKKFLLQARLPPVRLGHAEKVQI